MKIINKFRHNLPLYVFLLVSTLSFGQTQQKFKKSYPVQKDVAISVDTRHTKLVFETWDRNELEIETFIDTKDLSKEEITAAMAAWNVNVKGNRAAMSISSKGSSTGSFAMPALPSFDSLRLFSAQMIGPLMENMGPLLENFSDNPLPPELTQSLGSIKFDHEAYEREGEKYLEKWEKEIEEKFGPEFEIAMEEWSAKFERNSEVWNAKMQAEMEARNKELEKKMEEWGEQFGAKMEAWGEQFGKQMEQWTQELEEGDSLKIHRSLFISETSPNTKIKKTMIVRMPKGGSLKLNVRYGEVQLPEIATDLQAKLSHSKLVGSTITGSNTDVEASYSPVSVQDWQYGSLTTNYVKNCRISSANSLKLNSVSSDVKIGRLQETGIISGTFASLEIDNLAAGFRTLDLNLENSDLKLDLPNTALKFNYTGSKSKIKVPSSIKAEPVKSYDNEMINGYQKSREAKAVVNINAKFSDIVVD